MKYSNKNIDLRNKARQAIDLCCVRAICTAMSETCCHNSLTNMMLFGFLSENEHDQNIIIPLYYTFTSKS